MLSNNNMLTVGGGQRQRQRGTVRVSEPSKGFFITGSSIVAMSGVYIRRNPPRSNKNAALYYQHEDGVWHMILKQLSEDETEPEDDEDSDDDNYYYRMINRRQKKKKTHLWVITDEFGVERFSHDGDTIIPGAGVRWKHVHQKAAPPTASAALAVSIENTSTAIAEIKEDDEEELPWQVIAILDEDMVMQLWGGSMYHKEKVRDAKAGKNAPTPARASLESWFAPGRWLFRVTLPDGITLRVAADDSAQVAGTRKAGEYVRGVKLGSGGDWLCLDSSEDLEVTNASRGPGSPRMDHFYNAEYSRRQLWVRIYAVDCHSSSFLEEVPAEETAVFDLTAVGDMGDEETKGGDVDAELLSMKDRAQKDGTRSSSEPSGGKGLTGDLFDKPFVPRMEDGGSTELDPVTQEAIAVLRDVKAGLEDPMLVTLREAAAAAQTALLRSSEVPLGAVVEVSGLRSRVGEQYNGITGVVVTPPQAGRQGVRLDAPMSGKILACKPENLVFHQNEEDEDNEDFAISDSSEIARSARILGIELRQLGLAGESKKGGGGGGGDAEAKVATEHAWGFVGCTPVQRLGCALRAAIRDLGSAPVSVGDSRVRDSAAFLSQEIGARAVADFLKAKDAGSPVVDPAAADATNSLLDAPPVTSKSLARSPDLMLRFGALGSRAAAAAVSALSPLSGDEREAGLYALRSLVKEEVARAREADASVFMAAGEDSSGGDELLLRLALVGALLEGRRETDALAEAKLLIDFDDTKVGSRKGMWHRPAVLLLLGRCLLRQGLRTEGLEALERAENLYMREAQAEGDASLNCLQPLWGWAHTEVIQMLTAHRASERCRSAAVETYARGAFDDAAALFARALTLLQVGCGDDKRGRATLLADRAGCLRRARKLDDAVTDLETALRLFPRYTRALFRRAACLLEAGKATLAVEGFKDLYRVDRNWPMLSEWLVRAYSLQKRQAKGYKAEGSQYDDPTEPTQAGEEAGGGKAGGGGIGASASPDADLLAKEVDHYAVLGVSTDATEKQLKTAYRMRSLQFHPDRKQGNTAAFQRIASAYEVLSDSDKRRAYDEGGDIKVKKGHKDDEDDEDDSDEDEEHKTTMREEVEREFYPEKYQYWPFGDPFIHKRKHMAQKRAKEGKPKWEEEDGW